MDAIRSADGKILAIFLNDLQRSAQKINFHGRSYGVGHQERYSKTGPLRLTLFCPS